MNADHRVPAWPALIADADLRPHNSFAVRARAAGLTALTRIEQLDDLVEAAASYPQAPLLLGDGSNVLLVDDYAGLVVLNQLYGRRLINQDDEHAWVEIAAGENWDQLVDWSIAQGWFGLENLALIPGRVGAAPIQNIGAYGVEFESLCAAVQVYDPKAGNLQWLDAAQCQFAYRDSLFKRAGSRYWITAVRLRLRRRHQPNCAYAGVAEELQRLGLDDSQASSIAQAVRSLRRRKLPDPAQIGNAGSFFKNPVVSPEDANALGQQLAGLPRFEQDDGRCKLSAAYLIDQAGWKGYRDGDAGVHANHALVLVNHGQASGAQLYALAQRIAADVHDRYGVRLQIEPRVICAAGEP